MADLQDLLVRIDATTEQLRRELKRGEQAVTSAEQKINKSTMKMDQSFAKLGKAAISLAGAFGIAFGARGLVRHVDAQLKAADDMLKLTQRIGGTTEALSELQHVANLSGVSFNTMTMGLQRMTRRIAEAAKGTGEAKGAIRELGLDAQHLATLSLDQQFETLAGRIALVTNESDRVRLAMKLFDSEGVALVQTMTRGAEGIREMREEARRLGLTLSQDQAEAAAEARDEIARLTSAWQALSQTLILEASPALTDVLGRLKMLLFPAEENELQRQLVELGEELTRTDQRIAKLKEDFEKPLTPGARGYLESRLTEATLNRLRLEEEINKVYARRAALVESGKEADEPSGGGLLAPEDPLGSITPRPMRRIGDQTQNVAYERALNKSRQAMLREQERARQIEFQAVVDGLRTQEEVIADSHRRRLAIIMESTEAMSAEQLKYIDRLNEDTLEGLKQLETSTSSMMGGFGESLGQSMQDSFVNYFMGIEQDFGSMLKRMGIQMMTSQLFNFLGGMGGGVGKAFNFMGFGNAPTRHSGGSVSKNSVYKVKPDEEIFVPNMAGNVVPINKLQGGNKIQVNVINNTGSPANAQVSQNGNVIEVLLNAAKNGMASDIATGQMDSVFGARFGLRPTTGLR